MDESNPETKDEQNDKLARASEEAKGLTTCLTVLTALPKDAQERILRYLQDAFGRPGATSSSVATSTVDGRPPIRSGFSNQPSASPKQFLLDKRPQTDVDRITCLAFFLTHFRDQPFFKTQDLTALNSEAAAIRFSNTANAVENAAKAGLLVSASGGAKQLTAIGEIYVQALPDIERARSAVAEHRPRRRRTNGRRPVEGKDE